MATHTKKLYSHLKKNLIINRYMENSQKEACKKYVLNNIEEFCDIDTPNQIKLIGFDDEL